MAPNQQMVSNVVLAILIPGYLDLNCLWKHFQFDFSASLSVISTNRAIPCCRKYTSLSYICRKNDL